VLIGGWGKGAWWVFPEGRNKRVVVGSLGKRGEARRNKHTEPKGSKVVILRG
jgi:hypothetical protein